MTSRIAWLLLLLISTSLAQQITCTFTADNNVLHVYVDDVEVTASVTGNKNDWNIVKTLVFAAPLYRNAVFGIVASETDASGSATVSGVQLQCKGAPHWTFYSEPSQGWKFISNTADSFPANWYTLAYFDTVHPDVVKSTSGFSLTGADYPDKKMWGAGNQRFMAFRKRIIAPTLAPTTLAPTKTPTLLPTYKPTQLPTLSPSNPTSQFPSRTPSLSPIRTPTWLPTSSPSLLPTNVPTFPTPPYISPTESPSVSTPTRVPSVPAPTISPTNRPQNLNLCSNTESDLTTFVSYNNFFNYQASSCAAECRPALIAQVRQNTLICTQNCKVFGDGKYTPLCLTCLQEFLICQSERCTVCFASGNPYLANACKDCATQNCRAPLGLCTGFTENILSIQTQAPIDQQAQDAAQAEATNIGIIVGGSVAGVIAVLGAALLVRRSRTQRRADKEVQHMAQKLFGERKQLNMQQMSTNPVYDEPLNAAATATTAAAAVTSVPLRVLLRTRFSFHGTEIDELDVAAGASLLGISRNKDWWVAVDESTGRAGVIPASFVSEMS